MPSPYPIWFDIDGTLLHTRVGHEAFRLALLEIFECEDDLSTVTFAGNTDLQVLLDMVEKHGLCPSTAHARAPDFFAVMTRHLDLGLHNEKPQPVPGAIDLITTLSDHPHFIFGLITGNARACAEAKLRHAGFHHAFPHGGYGDEHHDRDILARRALESLQRHHPNRSLPPGLLIGDTPKDIQAARTIGARSLGVASGSYTSEALLQAGADRVVEHLDPTPDLLEWIFNP